jgi:hypothetical protein
VLDVAPRKPPSVPLRLNQTATRMATGLLLLIPVVAVCLGFWPGHMNADTLTQIDEVRTGNLTNRHAALLLAVWVPFWDLGVGPAFVLAGQVIVFVAGMFLLLRPTFSDLTAALLTALVSLSPPVFGMLGLLGRDVWFIGFLLLAFGLLVTVPGTTARARTALLAGVLVAAWLALAARQNAAPAVVMATIAWFGMVWRPKTARRVGNAVVVVAAGLGVTIALMATQAAATMALGVDDAHPAQYLYTYDIGSISHREHENLFPANVVPKRGMTAIDQHFTVNDVVPMLVGPGHPVEPDLSDKQADSLSDAWRTTVLDHPLDYLDTRWDIYWRQVALTQPAIQIYHPIIDENPFGLTIKFPGLNKTAKDYVEAFADPGYNGDVLFTVWVYLLAALAIGIYLVMRGRSAVERTIGAFGFGAVTFQAGIAAGAMGVAYRLEFPAVVIGLLSILLLLGVLVTRRRTTAAEAAVA